jgi:MscS family membrane protein
MFEELISLYLPQLFENRYLIAVMVFIFFFVVSKIFVYVVRKFILAITIRTKTNLDDELVSRTNWPISWLLIFIGAKIALEYLELKNGLAYYINLAALSLIYVAVGLVVISVVVTLIDFWGSKLARKTKSSMDDALIPLLRRTTKVIIFIFITIFVLDAWGINVTGLLAGVGIAGIAIGFAVKDSLANIFGGVSLILDKTFHVGDKIALDDGTIGLVSDVGIRATRIKTFDNEMIIVPNGTLANMRIKNFNLPDPAARIVVPFGVEYGVDPDKVKRIVLSELKKIKEVLKDPSPNVRFVEMADSSLNMKALFWVDEISKVDDKKEEATTAIYNALNKHKIGIPFPTRTLYVKK